MEEVESFQRCLCHFMLADGHWEPLLELADQVISWAESVGNSEIIALLLPNVLAIFRHQLAWARLEKWLERAQGVVTRFDDALLQAEIALVNGRRLGGAKGIELIQRSLAVFRPYKKYTSLVAALNSIGNIHLHQRHFEEATHCYQEGRSVLARFKHEIHAILALYELKLGHTEQADLLRQKADDIIERLKLRRPICEEDAEWMKLHSTTDVAAT